MNDILDKFIEETQSQLVSYIKSGIEALFPEMLDLAVSETKGSVQLVSSFDTIIIEAVFDSNDDFPVWQQIIVSEECAKDGYSYGEIKSMAESVMDSIFRIKNEDYWRNFEEKEIPELKLFNGDLNFES